MTKPATAPSATVEALKEAACLLNRKDLRSTGENEARAYNAAEKAVRDGIALIEDSERMLDGITLEWTEGPLLGQTVMFGRGLGLECQVAPMMSAPGWAWAVGDQIGSTEFTREEAMSACNADFRGKVMKLIRPPAASN